MPQQASRANDACVDEELTYYHRSIPFHEHVREADKKLIERYVEYVVQLEANNEYVNQIVTQLAFAQYGDYDERVAAKADQNEKERYYGTESRSESTWHGYASWRGQPIERGGKCGVIQNGEVFAVEKLVVQHQRVQRLIHVLRFSLLNVILTTNVAIDIKAYKKK